MTSSGAERDATVGGRRTRRRGRGGLGVYQKNLLGLRLNITADDDLIHKAHYGSLQMLPIRLVTKNCTQCVYEVF